MDEKHTRKSKRQTELCRYKGDQAMPPRPLTTTKSQRNIAWDTKAARDILNCVSIKDAYVRL